MEEERELNLAAPLRALGLTYSQLTEEHTKCLDFIESGEDCYLVLPTGSGQSLLFQLAPFLVYVTNFIY